MNRVQDLTIHTVSEEIGPAVQAASPIPLIVILSASSASRGALRASGPAHGIMQEGLGFLDRKWELKGLRPYFLLL